MTAATSRPFQVRSLASRPKTLAGAILSLVRLPNGTIRSAMEGHLQASGVWAVDN